MLSHVNEASWYPKPSANDLCLCPTPKLYKTRINQSEVDLPPDSPSVVIVCTHRVSIFHPTPSLIVSVPTALMDCIVSKSKETHREGARLGLAWLLKPQSPLTPSDIATPTKPPNLSKQFH